MKVDITGSPTAEEVAAVLAVLTSATSAAPAEEPAAPTLWNAPAALLRTPLRPGPGAWRAPLR